MNEHWISILVKAALWYTLLLAVVGFAKAAGYTPAHSVFLFADDLG